MRSNELAVLDFLGRLAGSTSVVSAALLFVATASPAADTTATPTTDGPGANPIGPVWQVGARDAGSTEWLKTSYVTNAVTGAVRTNSQRYVQVGSGLNFVDQSGNLQPSRDVIELQPDGSAAALHGPAKAHFSQNLNTYGAVTFVSQSNRVFQTHVIGLYFYNAADGSRKLVSGVKDCSAELLPPNQVIYRSAFQSIKADVRFTYTKSAIESDVIILENPPPPEAFSMDSSKGTIRLEVWHEFLNPPTPRIKPRILASITDPALRSAMVEPDFADQTLDFGDLWFPQGRIYFMDEYLNAPTNVAAQIRIADTTDPKEVPVAKRWAVSQDFSRTFLIESVPWLSVKPQLDLLPQGGQGAKVEPSKQRLLAGSFPAPPKKPHRSALRPVQLASGPYKPRGVCLDYISVSPGVDYTFASGNTYYLDSSGYFSGTVTLQTNCVIKFNTDTYLLTYGALVFDVDSNSPPSIILTSKDEDLFGDQISGSTGVPTYAASEALFPYYIPSSVTVSGVRIRWAQRGVQYEGTSGEFDNSSLELCQYGLYANQAGVNINNSTQCGVTTAVNDPQSFSGSLSDICTGDSDSNGLQDLWEFQFFGGIGVNPSADPDGDGLSNLQEYLLGTNPTKAPVPDANGAVRLNVFTPLK